jgi:asparagine synthase (glutamine-hydrolysing)
MSFFAGIYSRRSGDAIPDAMCASLERALSRRTDERFDRFRDERCFLVKVDIGAFGTSAFLSDESGASMASGEPLIARGDGATQSRSADLADLRQSFLVGNDDALRHTRGVFNAVHYRRDTGALVLLTDKLGIRPVFYWVSDRYIIFATALRVIEAIDAVDKVMDVRAVTEIGIFGFPLADRTPYVDVSLLLPAEILDVRGREVRRRTYWRWDDIAVSDRPVEALARDSYTAFMEGVRIRAGGDRTTIAFLSGGLDSRAIVTALRDCGMAVHTFGFSLEGSQDQIFGAEFSKRIGTTHTQIPRTTGSPAWTMVMSEAWKASPLRTQQPADRPQLVWSGDGGSVALGHVYLDQSLVDASRRGDRARLSDTMLHKWGGPVIARLLQPAVVEAVADTARRGLDEQYDAFRSEPGRALHLFLMQNDQRRHLAEHFEGMDLHRLEFELPFFDMDFVASVIRVPVDECVGHKYYMRWLRNFPAVAMSVPWQAYPGHEPCPLPMPDNVRYQWGESVAKSVRAADKKELHAAGYRALRSRDFAHPLLRKSYLRLSLLMDRFNIRDLGYVVRNADVFQRYWSRTGGRFRLPSR